MQRFTIIGNLGSDPETRNLENGNKVTKINEAVSKSWKDKNSGEWQEKTEWFDVVGWRYISDKMEKLGKGDKVYIEAELSNRTYENKQGVKVYVIDITAKMVDVMSKAQGSADHHKPASEVPTEVIPESVLNGDDDDLPF